MSPDFDRPTELARQMPVYLTPARVEQVVDGDTWDVLLSQGYYQYRRERIRAIDIDTRETSFVSHDSEEYQRGMLHTQYVEDWIEETRSNSETPWPVVAYTEEYNRGQRDRALGDLYSPPLDEWLTVSLYEEFDDVGLFE